MGNAKEKEYIAIGCVGTIERQPPCVNIPSDHIYKIVRNTSGDEPLVGWMSLEEAIEKFGEDNIIISHTSRHCALCLDIRRKSADILSGRLTIPEILQIHPEIVKNNAEKYARAP